MKLFYSYILSLSDQFLNQNLTKCRNVPCRFDMIFALYWQIWRQLNTLCSFNAFRCILRSVFPSWIGKLGVISYEVKCFYTMISYKYIKLNKPETSVAVKCGYLFS